MGQETLRNKEGKILTNSDGKLLKANYNFGKVFKGTARIDFNALLLSKGISVCASIKPGFNFHYLSYEKEMVFQRNFLNSNHNLYVIAEGKAMIYKETGCLGSPLFMIDSFDKKNINSFVNNYQINRSFNFKNDFINKVNLQKPAKYSHFLLFNRMLSEEEINYLYNKALGNEPLSLSQCIIYLNFSKAEIIANKVAIRDYSGNNNHAQITGLPTGAIEEQLAWANANLFEPF
ncbi:MAG: hypothetical protein MI784_09270 [Cytophagales bacterium]|nr:hypothetical protein [Cytophagales bacterium]